MREKNFILGVGCQKGGTSWLYKQLQKSLFVDMGFVKEYHIFDALYVKECNSFLNDKIDALKHLDIDNILNSDNSQLLKHITFYSDINNYFDYFDYLWHKNSQITTVGDITPSYSALPVEALSVIKNGLEEKGFNVKVIFLMRDPIERCWSSIRMMRRDSLRENPSQIFTTTEDEDLALLHNNKEVEIRTRYEVTIKNIESVFSPEQIFYGVYESLFTDEILSTLKEFLNLDDFNPDINQRINYSDKTKQYLNKQLVKNIFDFYKETYAFCDDKFDVKERWTGWKYS